MTTKPLELVRGLSGCAAAAIVVGTMVGTGIFIVPAEMARDAGSPGLILLAWVAGGALTLFGALSYAELGAAIPEAGGEYAYMTRAYGPRSGFLFGWMHSILGQPTSVATIAAGFARFLTFFVPCIAAPVFSLRLPHCGGQTCNFTFTWAQPVAVGAIAGVTFINYLGVRLGGRVQVTLTIVKIGAVIAVIAAGVAFGGSPDAALPHFYLWRTGSVHLAAFLTALVGALWAYDGWGNLNWVGSELQHPEKNIPRALIGGVGLVAALYILFTAACLHVLPFPSVVASQVVAADILQKLLGAHAARWLTLAMVACALGTLNSSILTGARVDYAMARDGIFFRIARGIHPRFRTPSRALLFQGCLASILALTGTFEDLYSLFIFASWIFYAAATASVIVLRYKEPNLPRPYRAWGYPVLPALFVLGAFALTLNLWLARPIRSTAGLALILSGLIFYRHWRPHSMVAPSIPK
jgi:APA family basic amino acid/polyamine antiporter